MIHDRPITQDAMLAVLRPFTTPEHPRTTAEIVDFLAQQFPSFTDDDLDTVAAALHTLGREAMAHAGELELDAAIRNLDEASLMDLASRPMRCSSRTLPRAQRRLGKR